MKNEMIEKAKQTQTPEELLMPAKEIGELSDDELEKVAGGVAVTGGRKVDPKKICLHYVCAACGGAKQVHDAKCEGLRMNCCAKCAHVSLGDDGCYYCFLCDRR